MRASLKALNDANATQTGTVRTVAQKRVLADNRPEAKAHRHLAELMNNSPRVLQQRALSNAIHDSSRMVVQRHRMSGVSGGALAPKGDGVMPAVAAPAPREQEKNSRVLQTFNHDIASMVTQREIDISSSPSLPDYDPDETPAWQVDRGVPEWAKEAYIEEAPMTLIASVKDGKIGSIYYANGRIRTTHAGGPIMSITGVGQRRLQFNINNRAAEIDFNRNHPLIDKEIGTAVGVEPGRPLTDDQKKQCQTMYRRRLKGWIARFLSAQSVESMPAWATAVTSADDALDLYEEEAPAHTALFEVFVDINGKVESWHPSRGAAARFDTDKQVDSVLRAALAMLDRQGIVGPYARNVAFYNFIRSRLPEFIKNIRNPADG